MANEPEKEFDDEPIDDEEGDEEGDEDEIDDDELSSAEAEERYLAILQSATEITAAAVSNAGAQALENPDQVAQLFTKVFDAIVDL